MLKIKLVNNNIYAIISECDSKLSNYQWYLSKDGYPITYNTPNNKIHYKYGKKMHKLVIKLHGFNIGKSNNLVIDHINRNKLDNRIENLRICTAKENSYNKSKIKNTQYNYKGVKKNKDLSWSAIISKDKKVYTINNIDNEEDAAKIYDMMAEELFGIFASKNFQ